MSYPLRIGWRYLHRGSPDRKLLRLTGVGLVVAVAALLVTLAGSPGMTAVITLVAATCASVVFALLSCFSVFTSVSMLGVVIGVAALTTVLAVTTGFEEQFRDKVLGVHAHVMVRKLEFSFPEYRAVMERVQSLDPSVVAVQPFVYAEVLATNGRGQVAGVALKGVDPARVSAVLDLDRHMIEGGVASLARRPAAGEPSPVIVGKSLARALRVKVGDVVSLVVPLSNIDFETMSAKNAAPRSQRFVVSGIFYCGFEEFDRRLLYAALGDAEALRGEGDDVDGLELKLEDPEQAGAVARAMARDLGAPPFDVQGWFELNETMFRALSAQKIVLTTILAFIIAVAAFNMVSALTSLVTEKTRDIAILKSMGATSTGVTQIFAVVGAAISVLGTAIGIGLGGFLCHVISRHGFRLDPKVYFIDRLPIAMDLGEVVLVSAIALAIGLVATIIPAVRASAMRPMEGLRYD
jgi:lipoprotein-releasing system permease protein